MMNVDATGVSMSWKTAVTIISFVIFVMMTWNTFAGTLLKAADLTEHNASTTAHAQLPAHVDHIQKAEVVAMVEPIRKQAAATSRTVIQVQNGFYDKRAADLAYRAVDNLPKNASTRTRITRFEWVKSRALKNLREGRDILDGIHVPVM